MPDDELSAWVAGLIERRTPESHTLDYKLTIAVEGRVPKRVENPNAFSGR
jgi:hypothetical protein